MIIYVIHQQKLFSLTLPSRINGSYPLCDIDDNGKEFTLSPDPLLDALAPYVADFRLGEPCSTESRLEPVLKNEAIFGVNLYDVGMAGSVCRYLEEMLAGPGAVRKTLEKYV